MNYRTSYYTVMLMVTYSACSDMYIAQIGSGSSIRISWLQVYIKNMTSFIIVITAHRVKSKQTFYDMQCNCNFRATVAYVSADKEHVYVM